MRFSCIGLAILLLGAILRRDELRHQGQHHVVAAQLLDDLVETGLQGLWETGSSLKRMELSVGIFFIPNRVWQFDVPCPCSRWRC